jgi:hypothetical protein
LITLACRAEASVKAGARYHRHKNFQKTFPLPCSPCRIEIQPDKFLPKTPMIRQEQNSKRIRRARMKTNQKAATH